ncbi:MAG: sulfotransferase [Deltaproteobacteria bacterium]|nr:sulfotransferase [Deltaproteobacteria bacterium]
MIEKSGLEMMLDKTPAYGLVLPFLSKLYPTAKYVVLTRHPLAVLSSYANSFFEGDYDAAVEFNDILGRYVPAMAAFMRQSEVPFHRVRYEDLVGEPEVRLAEIFEFLGLPNEEGAVDYGKHDHVVKSYGDPKASQETRPTTKSVSKWAAELASDEHKLELAQQVCEPLEAEDVELWGYDKEALFDPVAEAAGDEFQADKKWKWNKYRMRRRMFLKLRKNIHTNGFGRAVKRVKYYCDVLLRD